MKRILILAGMLGLALSLSACDKCGNLHPLVDTKSCGGDKTTN